MSMEGKVFNRDLWWANRLHKFIQVCSRRQNLYMESGDMKKALWWLEEQKRALVELDQLIQAKDEQDNIIKMVRGMQHKGLDIHKLIITLEIEREAQ
ncbi:hypothetical protein ACFFJY_07915 [Fictibacillus aquaticus]|uniref:Uncharacterized protein n=1 Tax=Fictibacillus aquaticus TaxID=2021314 RepID=A0A235FA79_9BACL|nr:hypothetical protein [Fictibacillus aquaticus]OYD57893.1 hypothetical protein CGZ90_08305 [Fictibacillus aquaticus]